MDTVTIKWGAVSGATSYTVQRRKKIPDAVSDYEVVKKGVTALDPRGKEFSPANMSERLAVRNLFTDLREQGQMGGGPPPHSEKDKQAFANALDRILTRLMKPL